MRNNLRIIHDWAYLSFYTQTVNLLLPVIAGRQYAFSCPPQKKTEKELATDLETSRSALRVSQLPHSKTT